MLRGECAAPITALLVFGDLGVQKVTNDISERMTAAPQARIQELGGQHGIDEGAVDLQACLAQKFEIKLGIVEDFDHRRLGEHRMEGVSGCFWYLPEINDQYGPSWRCK